MSTCTPWLFSRYLKTLCYTDRQLSVVCTTRAVRLKLHILTVANVDRQDWPTIYGQRCPQLIFLGGRKLITLVKAQGYTYLFYVMPPATAGMLRVRHIRPSVCLSVLCAPTLTTVLLGNGYYRTLIGNPMLEDEPTGQRGRIYGYRKWQKRQWSRRQRCFRSIRQMAATRAICGEGISFHRATPRYILNCNNSLIRCSTVLPLWPNWADELETHHSRSHMLLTYVWRWNRADALCIVWGLPVCRAVAYRSASNKAPQIG